MRALAAAILLTACASHPAPVTAPTMPAAVHVSVDIQHCAVGSNQPDDRAMTFLVCLGEEPKSVVGVIVATEMWNQLTWAGR